MSPKILQEKKKMELSYPTHKNHPQVFIFNGKRKVTNKYLPQ